MMNSIDLTDYLEQRKTLIIQSVTRDWDRVAEMLTYVPSSIRDRFRLGNESPRWLRQQVREHIFKSYPLLQIYKMRKLEHCGRRIKFTLRPVKCIDSEIQRLAHKHYEPCITKGCTVSYTLHKRSGYCDICASYVYYTYSLLLTYTTPLGSQFSRAFEVPV